MIRYRVFWNGKMCYPEDRGKLDIMFVLQQDGILQAFPTEVGKRYDPVDYVNAEAYVSLQYKDGNGREIYACDIITNDHLESIGAAPVAVYDIGHIQGLLDKRGVKERLADLKRWRVIGNTRENPELI